MARSRTPYPNRFTLADPYQGYGIDPRDAAIDRLGYASGISHRGYGVQPPGPDDDATDLEALQANAAPRRQTSRAGRLDDHWDESVRQALTKPTILARDPRDRPRARPPVPNSPYRIGTRPPEPEMGPGEWFAAFDETRPPMANRGTPPKRTAKPKPQPTRDDFADGIAAMKSVGSPNGPIAALASQDQATEYRDHLDRIEPIVRGKPYFGLGLLAAIPESSGNPGKESTGRHDPGGRSYGTYQIATNVGTASNFVASPEFNPWVHEFKGLAPGTRAFGDRWQAVAARDPAFAQAQYDYLRRTHYGRSVRDIERTIGYDLNNASDAVRNVVWSVSIQHSRAPAILRDAVRRTDAEGLPRSHPDYERRLIDNIYDRRSEHVAVERDKLRARRKIKKAETLNNVIKNRYPEERARAQQMLADQRQK